MPSEEEFCKIAKQELSYDAWGRLRNPATQAAYAPGSEPILFLRRGYTGHEHHYWFGLVNMNARLYDPVLGRFLSPDPYVGNPFMTQNYNRYTYAMNNPLVYIDQDGELPLLAIIGIFAGFVYLKAAHDNTPKEHQGDLRKWNWNPLNWDWKNANYAVSVGSNTGPSGGIGGAVGVGWNNGPMINMGYNQNSGWGIGYGENGCYDMYYPGYDYSKPEKAAAFGVYQAQQEYKWQKGPLSQLTYYYSKRPDNTGVELKMMYYFKRNSYYWYQTVNTNRPINNNDNYFIDALIDSKWINTERVFAGNYYSTFFHDLPRRMNLSNGDYWKAETSLVKVRNNTYEIVATCTWGFGMENNQFQMYQLNWGKPSKWHIDIMYKKHGITFKY